MFYKVRSWLLQMLILEAPLTSPLLLSLCWNLHTVRNTLPYYPKYSNEQHQPKDSILVPLSQLFGDLLLLSTCYLYWFGKWQFHNSLQFCKLICFIIKFISKQFSCHRNSYDDYKVTEYLWSKQFLSEIFNSQIMMKMFLWYWISNDNTEINAVF